MPAESQPTRMIGYARVSTDEQAEEGYGLDAQEAELRRTAEYRRWELVDVVRDEGESAGTLDRPGLQSVLRRCLEREVDGFFVVKLDRLTRSQGDFIDLLEWLEDADVAFTALDLPADLTTTSGRMIASVLVIVSEWERGQARDRTRAGLAAKRAKGESIGRPAIADRPELAARIGAMRDSGMTLQAIADQLTAEGVPTARGAAVWRPSSVQSAAGYKRPKRKRKRTDLPEIPKRRRS